MIETQVSGRLTQWGRDAGRLTIEALQAVLRSAPDDAAEMQDLVDRSRAGDQQAFNELVGSCYHTVLRLAWRMLRDRSAAEDATQEIFVKAWKGLPRFRGAARFNTWLHVIAVRHCVGIARRRTVEVPYAWCDDVARTGGGGSLASDGMPRPDRPLEWGTRLSLHEAVARLPEKLRCVVVLTYFLEYSPQEVASVLGIPRNTVRSRLRLGLERLRRELGAPEVFG